MCQGVTKSGSPTPREITPSVEESRSKNLLISENEMLFSFCEIKLSRVLTKVGFILGVLWHQGQSFESLGGLDNFSVILISLEQKVGDGALHFL